MTAPKAPKPRKRKPAAFRELTDIEAKLFRGDALARREIDLLLAVLGDITEDRDARERFFEAGAPGRAGLDEWTFWAALDAEISRPPGTLMKVWLPKVAKYWAVTVRAMTKYRRTWAAEVKAHVSSANLDGLRIVVARRRPK